MAQAVLPDVHELGTTDAWSEDALPFIRLAAGIIQSALHEAQRRDALGQQARSDIAAGGLDHWSSLLAPDEATYQELRRRLRLLAGVGMETGDE